MVLLQCEFLIVRKNHIEVFQTFLLEKNLIDWPLFFILLIEYLPADI